MPNTTLKDFLEWAEDAFVEANLFFGHGTDNAWDEAVAIARYILNLEPNVTTEVLSQVLSDKLYKQLQAVAEKRINDRIPLPYLIHEAWFAGLKFYVDERVIIPRSPLGELIEMKFQPWLKLGHEIQENQISKKLRILDLCTGSGCIAIACAYAFPEAVIDAVDISRPSLDVAQKNIEAHGLSQRVHLYQSDLFETCLGKQYDIIISNPPYVNAEDLENVPPEFTWEPKLALAAGKDGLDIVRRILAQASNFLTDQGLLIVEVGASSEALSNAYPHTPFIWIEFERGGEGVFLLYSEDKLCWKIY